MHHLEKLAFQRPTSTGEWNRISEHLSYLPPREFHPSSMGVAVISCAADMVDFWQAEKKKSEDHGWTLKSSYKWGETTPICRD